MAAAGVVVTTIARTLVDLSGMVGLGTLRKAVGRAVMREREAVLARISRALSPER